ncbi:MAG: glucosyl-3-phosphoglycerate synthase [Actinomycetota bacterium]|nr:glucosyl-3-phosphoglycerate synthase [Actinomycetota bacterium]
MTAPARPRRFHHRDFTVADLRARRERVCVLLPAREEARTIGAILDVLVGLRESGALDDVLVIDARSADGTAQVAARAGARVAQRDDLLAEFGPALGKGDAVWRGLSATDAEIVCVLDADLEDFDERYVLGLVGPLLREPGLALVKGAFARPYTASDGTVTPGEGGRVTELMARPLLALLHPELAGFSQPLSGQWAARRELLAALEFWTGYALEICLLLEAHDRAGLHALAECDLGTLVNRHQPLGELGSMASAVLRGVLERLVARGRLPPLPAAPATDGAAPAILPRPPLATITPGARPLPSCA